MFRVRILKDWAEMTIHFSKGEDFNAMIDIDNVDWTRNPQEDTSDLFEALEYEFGYGPIEHIKLKWLGEVWTVNNNNE